MYVVGFLRVIIVTSFPVRMLLCSERADLVVSRVAIYLSGAAYHRN